MIASQFCTERNKVSLYWCLPVRYSEGKSLARGRIPSLPGPFRDNDTQGISIKKQIKYIVIPGVPKHCT